ncbi:MAG: hypothetical protein H0X36_05750 [Sphingomonadaceae bacterium]|nr:hypothetical protein [Sphingomonadaceae bacterium]
MNETLPVVVNSGGGAAARAGDKLGEKIEAAFDKAGLAIALHAVEGDEIAKTVAKLAASGGTVAVGGGDGTLGASADALSEADATLGILPLGTRNHLARELGIPMDLEGAAVVIAARATRRIDLSRAGDRTFVNNASIGIYPRMVRARDAQNLPKWLANFPAAWTTLKQARHHRLRLTLDGSTDVVRTPLLFVGNNIYSLDAGHVGTREAMDDGKLSVFAVADRSRLGLIGFALRTLAGRGDPERDFCALGICERLTVDARGRGIDVAIDGEVMRLSTPLEFAVRPGALTVLAPPEKSG